MNYDTRVKSIPQRGFVALMATIIISLILLVMVVQEGTSGWYARFNILGTEAKEQASALAEGCAEQALAALVTDPYYTGNSTSTTAGGTCHVFPIEFNTPAAGLVTISTQAQVRGSFANLAAVLNTASVHLGSTPASPTRGTLIVYTHVINDNGGVKTAADFTQNIAAIAPSKLLPFAGDEGGVVVTMAPGAYSMSENAMSGYTENLSAACTGTIAAGEVKACVITNDDVLTTLTVIANVINDNGGIHPISDFTLYIDGVAKTPGQPYVVTPGAHMASNVSFAGYTASPWGYNCLASGSVTLNSGDNKTCIITIDDNPPAAPTCADTVMMLDRTGSMSSSDLTGERAAANSLINLYSGVTPQPKIGVGVFGDGSDNNGNAPAKVVGLLSTAYASLTSAVNTWLSSSEGFTNLGDAITKANDELNSVRHDPAKEKMLIIVSDGGANRPTGGAAFDTGFLAPSANAQNAAGDVWNNPAGAYNATDATSTASAGRRERYSTFGFGGGAGLPSGSTVTGIEAQISSLATAGTVTGPVTNSAKSPAVALAPNQWTNPNNAFVSDDIYTTSATANNQQAYGNFGFTIPANATITGIGVTTEAKITGAPSTLVSDNFGTGATDPLVTPWTEGLGNNISTNGAERRAIASGNDDVSPDGGRFATIFNDSNNDGWICRSVNASGLSNLLLSYYWRGDSDAESSDLGVVEYRVGGSCTSSFGWNSLQNHDLSSDGSWSTQSPFTLPTSLNNTTFFIRFRANSSANNEFFRVDGVLLTGAVSASGSLSVALSSNNGGAYTAPKTANLTSTQSVITPTGNSSTDLWGRAWAPADFTNGNFTLRVQNTSATGPVVSLDNTVVTVYYTTPISAPVACQLGVDLSWNAGTSWSNEKIQTLTGATTTYTLGASNDDWSGTHTWGITEFNNTNFRARIHGIDPGAACDNSAVDHVDDLKIKVHYTLPTDPTTYAYAAADAAKQSGTSIFAIHFGDASGRDLLAKLASGPTPNPPHQNGSFADPGGITSGNTGLISPTAQAADTGGDGNGFESNPNNALTDGSGSASNNNGTGDRHRFSGYNFTLPPGATVTGVAVRLDWWLESTSGTNSMGVELSWNGGTNWVSKTSTDESTNSSNTDTVGSSGDTWGRTWAAGDFGNGNFRVRLTSNCSGSSSCSSRDFFLDWVPVTVYYTVNAENGDGDDFFIAPTAADMQNIFEFIGSQVCPAASAPPVTPPPTTATLLITTIVVNDNGGTKVPSDFTTNVSATNASQTTFAGNSGGTSVTIDPGGYSVTEVGVAGYTERPSATCSSALSGPIVAGETRACALVNDDIPPPPPPPNLTITTGSFEEVPDGN